MSRLKLCAGLAVWALACTEPSDRVDESTARVVTTSAAQITEELRIDGYDADLVGVGGVAVAPDGTIAILQPPDHLVLFFDADGNRIGSIRPEGQGPGEFR